MRDAYNKNNKNIVFLSITPLCFFLSLLSSVANSPGLIWSVRVSDFDLRTPGVALQSPVYGTNYSCAKKTLSDRSDVISEVPICSQIQISAQDTAPFRDPHHLLSGADAAMPPEFLG